MSEITTTNPLADTLRNEDDRARIVGKLHTVATASVDVVAPQAAFNVSDDCTAAGLLLPEPIMTANGVHQPSDIQVTEGAWRQVAGRLNIPRGYLNRLREGHADLAAENVNTLAGRDERTALYRLLELDGALALRAMVSDSYQPIDNLDAFVAVTQGLQAAGHDLGECQVKADWTNERFRLRITVPAVEVAAPDLLEGYRSPFMGADEQPPVLWAGLEISNSETGGGAFTIAPRAEVLICRNGMVRTKDMVRQVHAGARLEPGVVQWTQDTKRKTLELVQAQVRDAAATFCSAEYLEAQVAEMRAARDAEVASVPGAFRVVSNQLGYSDAEVEAAMDAFLRSGDSSVLGVAHAVTAAAQGQADGDRQAEMESDFWKIVQRPQLYASAS